MQGKKCLNIRQKRGNQEHCRTLTLSFTHSRHAEQLLFSCLCSKVTLTLSISYSLTLNMLNNFCFHVYAQKSLFIGEHAMPHPILLV